MCLGPQTKTRPAGRWVPNHKRNWRPVECRPAARMAKQQHRLDRDPTSAKMGGLGQTLYIQYTYIYIYMQYKHMQMIADALYLYIIFFGCLIFL